MAGAKGLLDGMRELESLPGRNKLPPNVLSLDFFQRKPLGKLVARVMVEDDSRVCGLMGEPNELLQQLAEARAEHRQRLDEVGIVLAAYVFHDVVEGQRSDFIHRIREACPGAALAIADYTMLEMNADDAIREFTADLERQRMAEQGREGYLRDHMQLTYRDIGLLLGQQFSHVRGIQLPGARAVILGGDRDIWMNQETSWKPFLESCDTDPRPASAIGKLIGRIETATTAHTSQLLT